MATAKKRAESSEIKTGRRMPSFAARDQTVCFTLSEGEKRDVDTVAFCMNITRSGMLAKIAADFVAAALDPKNHLAEKTIAQYLAQCRKAVAERGQMAAEFLGSK